MNFTELDSIHLDLVTKGNREEVFEIVKAALENKLIELNEGKKKVPRVVTNKFLCSFDEAGFLNISHNVVAIEHEQALTDNEFWWPCSYNGGGYDMVLSKWFRSKMEISGLKIRQLCSSYCSEDAEQFICREIDRFAGPVSLDSEEGAGFEDALNYTVDDRVREHLQMAAGYIVESESSKNELWKALEHAYLAGRLSIESDERKSLDLAKHGKALEGGATIRGLLEWQEEAKLIYETNPQIKPKEMLRLLRESGTAVTRPGYRVYLKGANDPKGILPTSCGKTFRDLKKKLDG